MGDENVNVVTRDDLVAMLKENNTAIEERLIEIAGNLNKREEPEDEDDVEDGNLDLSSLIDDDPQVGKRLQSLVKTKKQAQDLIELVEMISTKKAGATLKNEVLSEVDRRDDYKQKSYHYGQKATAKFPQLLDPRSDLSKKAIKIFDSMDKAKKADPASRYLAAVEAADELGIEPISLATIRQQQARAEVAGGDRGEDGPPEVEDGWFDLFPGVDKKAVEAAVKADSKKKK